MEKLCLSGWLPANKIVGALCQAKQRLARDLELPAARIKLFTTRRIPDNVFYDSTWIAKLR